MKQPIVIIGMLGILVIALGISASYAFRVNRDNSMAPSYEEIQQNVYRITRRDINPTGPEVGPDGLVDNEIEKALSAYSRSMWDKKVEGWVGWYEGYTEIEPGTSYNVGIFMKKPEPGRRAYADIIIGNVPANLLPNLKSWQTGQPIMFDGLITAVWHNGNLWIEYGAIETTDSIEPIRLNPNQ